MDGLVTAAVFLGIAVGVAGILYLAKIGITRLDRARGIEAPEPKKGQSDALVAFGALIAIVGALMATGGQLGGLVIGALGVAMIVVWLVRRSQQAPRA